MSKFRDAYIEIRINRNTAIAIVVSLLVHLLGLFWLSSHDLLNQKQPPAEPGQTMDVELQLASPAKAPASAPPAEAPPPEPPKRSQAPKVRAAPVSRPEPPREIANSVPVLPPPAPVTRNIPPPKPTPPEPAQQFTDMASYVNAQRERRRQAGDAPDLANAEAAAQDEAKMGRLNPQPTGTNGVFSILSMDNRNATIAFRGWKNEFSYSHREEYQVSAGKDGDLPRAIIRKMIEIIRRYYTGDFNWNSDRLGRVIVLSARLQDNDGLEDFLLQEFFGSRGIQR